MKNLLCTNPAIILNPHLKDLILTHRNYTFRGVYHHVDNYTYNKWFYFFDYRFFGTRNHKIKVDDIDTCYITDVNTGELLPIYIQVPCNKCELCRDKVAREWSTRAMCESQTSTSQPLFITLTYNDANLPKDGVSKEHAQTFIKRLRININRYVGYDVNLRFFLCSEYGSKTKRPHYHALIWNFPLLDNLKRTLSIIEKSWSFMVSKTEYDKYPADFKFRDGHSNRYRVRFGYAYCSLANGQRIKYSMKYMRKDCEVPQGSNPLFFLSSRKRGLGYEWMSEHANEIFNNPQINDIKLIDKWSNEIFTGTMPSYFKSLLFPTLSKVLPKDIRDTFKLFNYKLNIHRMLLGKYAPKDYYSDDKELIDKYRCIPFHKYTELPHFYMRCLKLELRNTENYMDDYSQHVKNLSVELESLRKKLWHYDFDCAAYEKIIEIKGQRLYYIENYINSLPQVDVTDRLNSLRRRRHRQLLNEVF